MKICDGWVVYETQDEYGRRGRLVGVFTDEAAATVANSGVGWYGGEGSKEKVGLLEADDGKMYILASRESIQPNVNLIDETKRQKEAALAKLTPAERILLGLNA